MNRSAVALAADSAVTLSGQNPLRRVEKIFQNENKLFELSRKFPVGLMIYNATSFFEIPWEVIIKDFRQDAGDTASDSIFDWANCFTDYLAHHSVFHPDRTRQHEFARDLLQGEFSRVINAFFEEAQELVFLRQTKPVREKYPAKFVRVLEKRIRFYESYDYYSGHSERSSSSLLQKYEADYLEAKEEFLGDLPLEDSDDDLLRRLAKGVLSRSATGWYTTGLVFAGYGSKELFPSLFSIEVGGMLDDSLRWNERRRVDIDRTATTAEIIPFAQRETVDTLLFGRADPYERHVVDYFTEAAKQVGFGIVRQLTKNRKKGEDFNGRVEAAVTGVVSKFFQNSEEIKRAFAINTLDSVRHMPKPDLAAFAESLVTVTSMMRKASIGPETVGGPIDVAVISKHEGFIWVKRKHYFDKDINQRYTWRAFGGSKGDVTDA